jgi:hypothetical protein
VEAIISGAIAPGATFGERLKDGVVLCKLANTLRPGIVPRVIASRMPFKQMENINSFLRAVRALGVADHDCFETVDLFELKNVRAVVRCLRTLGEVTAAQPGYEGPKLGDPPVAVVSAEEAAALAEAEEEKRREEMERIASEERQREEEEAKAEEEQQRRWKQLEEEEEKTKQAAAAKAAAAEESKPAGQEVGGAVGVAKEIELAVPAPSPAGASPVATPSMLLPSVDTSKPKSTRDVVRKPSGPINVTGQGVGESRYENISVEKFERIGNHTSYTVVFSQAGITWAVKHRYSDFLSLFNHLRRDPHLRAKNLIECLSFPPKRFSSLSEVQLEIRRVRLDRFAASVAELSQHCSAFSLGALAQFADPSKSEVSDTMVIPTHGIDSANGMPVTRRRADSKAKKYEKWWQSRQRTRLEGGVETTSTRIDPQASMRLVRHRQSAAHMMRQQTEAVNAQSGRRAFTIWDRFRLLPESRPAHAFGYGSTYGSKYFEAATTTSDLGIDHSDPTLSKVAKDGVEDSLAYRVISCRARLQSNACTCDLSAPSALVTVRCHSDNICCTFHRDPFVPWAPAIVDKWAPELLPKNGDLSYQDSYRAAAAAVGGEVAEDLPFQILAGDGQLLLQESLLQVVAELHRVNGVSVLAHTFDQVVEVLGGSERPLDLTFLCKPSRRTHRSVCQRCCSVISHGRDEAGKAAGGADVNTDVHTEPGANGGGEPTTPQQTAAEEPPLHSASTPGEYDDEDIHNRDRYTISYPHSYTHSYTRSYTLSCTRSCTRSYTGLRLSGAARA